MSNPVPTKAHDTFRINDAGKCYWTQLECIMDCRKCNVHITQTLNAMMHILNRLIQPSQCDCSQDGEAIEEGSIGEIGE